VVLVAITTITASILSVPHSTEARNGSDVRSTLVERYRSIVEMRTQEGNRYKKRDDSHMMFTQHRVSVFKINNQFYYILPSPSIILTSTEKIPASEPATTMVENTKTTKPKSPQPKTIPAVSEITPVVVSEEVVNNVSANTSADEFMTVLASEIHRLTNIERQRAGVSTLEYDSALATVAKGHSEDMAKRNYFSHISPDGCNLGCRLNEAGYVVSSWGENIAWRSSNKLPEAEDLAVYFVGEWMNSDGHRRNILSSKFTHEGVGIAQIGNKVYATVNFSRPW